MAHMRAGKHVGLHGDGLAQHHGHGAGTNIFGHQKRLMYMAQHQALRLLVDQKLFVDHHFTLQFDTRPDQREGRPNNYPGRLVHGAWGERLGLQVQE